MKHLPNASEMNLEKKALSIAEEITIGKIIELLPALEGKLIEAVVLYGSCAQPETMRKGSDLDIKVIIKLEKFDDDFKYHYSNKAYAFDEDELEIDLKYYTPESFRKELLFGSFTRLFALLNAYKILSDQSGTTTEIIQHAHERMDEIIDKVKNSLRHMELDDELNKFINYMSGSYDSLCSEKLAENRLGLGLRLFEYSKYFIIQFERLVFAKALQSGKEHTDINTYIKNMLMFQQHDGNRLLDYHKYTLDEKITLMIDDINVLMRTSSDLHETVKSLYNYFDKMLLDSFDNNLIKHDNSINEFFTFQTIGA